MAWYDITDWYEPDDKFGNLDPRTVAQLQRAWGQDFSEATAEFWERISDRFPEIRHDRETMLEVRKAMIFTPGDHRGNKAREMALRRYFDNKYDVNVMGIISDDDWELLRIHYEETYKG